MSSETLLDDKLLEDMAQGERLTLAGAGAWIAVNSHRLEARIDGVIKCNRAAKRVDIDMGKVERLDTFGAWLLERLVRGFSARGCDTNVTGLKEDFRALMDELHAWLNAQLAKLSRHHDLAKAINYMLRRWDAFARFLTDGQICLTNNAAERALRCVPLGRKAWLFCGSDRGGQRAAIVYSLIQTCRLNDVDPQAWLADTLPRLAAGHPATALDQLMPWNRAAAVA